MSKFLVQATYTADGLRGLQKDKASGRREAVTKAVKSLDGQIEALYGAFGEHDVVMIVDLPDAASAAAMSITASASGFMRTRVTPLMTVEEMDRALAKSPTFRPPGG
jgi:uncharacterized protein with GYD domain